MAASGAMLCIILITIFIPPLGVFLISGCSADLCINILLTLLGYIPGHIHAFYLEYVYYNRRGMNPVTRAAEGHAPGVYSDRIQTGGHGHASQQPNYGTV